ncbi:hypothetical protein GYB22_04635 [bacterium]|nr:hypothetical protein [bacterium]
MKQKLGRIIKKWCYHLPFGWIMGMAVFYLIWGWDPGIWFFGLIIGLFISSIVILINVNDYNSIKGLGVEDFMNSNHKLNIGDNNEILNDFKQILDMQFVQPEVFVLDEHHIRAKLPDSFVDLRKSENGYILSVQRNNFPFLPDRAKNYKLLTQVAENLVQLDYK